MAEFGLLSEWRVYDIEFLIAWLGTLPSDHWVALRGEEAGCLRRDVEVCAFAKDSHASALSLSRDAVAICDVVIADVPLYFKCLSIRSFESGDAARCLVADA